MPKPFVKGDPRINRKGRPKSFDAVRELAQAIAHEEATKEGKPVIVNGHIATATEIVLRQWLTSGNFQKQLAFMQYAYGKVPDVVVGDHDNGPIKIVIMGKKDDE